MDFEQQLGIKLSVLTSGLIGGIVSLTYEERISAQRALLLIVGGASTAAYLQPLTEHYLGIPEKFSTGLGFVLGLVSMKIIDFIIQNTQHFLKAKFIIRQNADSKSIVKPGSHLGNNTHSSTRAAGKKTKYESEKD